MWTTLSGKMRIRNPILRFCIDFWYVLSIIVIIVVVALAIIFSRNSDGENQIDTWTWKPDESLIFAHTICRHGDRNINPPSKNDPWSDPVHWPGGFSQLTKLGKQQHYVLGQYLRERYAKLLENDDYSVDKVFVLSTDTDRTLMSAAACLAGLFPPSEDQIWNDNLKWQPIPIHTVPRHEDDLLTPQKQCDRYEYDMIEYTNSSEYKSVFEKNKLLIQYLEMNSGEKLNSLKSIHYLYDQLNVEQSKGKRLPPWTESIKSNIEFESLLNFASSLHTRTSEFKKLRSGFLLKEILDRSTSKSMSTLSPDRQLWMYFAHYSTIRDMLSSLGLQQHGIPYASCLSFELYKTQTENYIELFYRNSTEKYIPALEIPNCGIKCPLNKWYELYKDILPTKSYDEECKLSDGQSLLPNHKNPEHF